EMIAGSALEQRRFVPGCVQGRRARQRGDRNLRMVVVAELHRTEAVVLARYLDRDVVLVPDLDDVGLSGADGKRGIRKEVADSAIAAAVALASQGHEHGIPALRNRAQISVELEYALNGVVLAPHRHVHDIAEAE